MSEAIAGNIAKAQTLADGSVRLYIDMGEVNPAVYPWLYQTGQAVALAVLNEHLPASTTDSVPRETTLAERIHTSGYFNNPKLWDAMEAAGIYTQQQHRRSIEKQRCFMRDGKCNGEVVMHHVRTAANSGTGIKPADWFGIPLCHHHHDEVHRDSTRLQRQIMLEAAVAYTADAMKVAMKFVMKRESLSGVTQNELSDFEHGIGFVSGFLVADTGPDYDRD